MHLQNDDPHGIREMLARRVGYCADAAEIAYFSVSIWNEIEVALAPIFEETGVAAIYRRTLELTAVHHPCLVEAYECERSPGKFANLAVVLVEQNPEYASAVLVSLLNTFHILLTDVFGGSMFERLLRSIWDRQCDTSESVVHHDDDRRVH